MVARMRLWNPEWYSSAIPVTDIRRRNVHGVYPLIFEIIAKEIATANATELGAAKTNALDGTAAGVSLYITSSSADDDNDLTDKAVRKIRIIGLSSPAASNLNFVYSVEEINMNGVANVRSVRYYSRVMHAYASDWGSGGADAAGDISVESPENTNLVVIGNGTNESNGTMIYVPDGYYGRWKLLDLTLHDIARAEA